MNAREFKDNIYSEIASVSKALANPHRLEIVELLAQGPSSVEYVAEQVNLSVASASHHLQSLKKARLVSMKKKGKYRYYSLSNQHVFEVWRSMRELAFSQNAEINKLIGDYRESQNNLEPITIEELKKRHKKGNALLIDVRPGQEYEAGHITSSLSVPKDELQRRLKDLPKNKEIIAYCRGPLCTLADEAVAELKQKGYKATKLDVGYPEWHLATT
ncbi:ArsR/SmtB family transcription factor [Rhodohalobacter sp. 8-1]|uniref:ArsR/SmtB family transcription factor n=1 Tax=Rhodohalobacter sp. 8-1 TaxID=3131972 RepID=UPI0030EF51A8